MGGMNSEKMQTVYTQRQKCANQSGQAMVEYILAAVVVIGIVVVLAYFLSALKLSGNRVLDLVASEYP